MSSARCWTEQLASQQLAGGVDVGAHLRHQVIDGVEAHLAAQPLGERNFDRHAVELEVAVEDVRLHLALHAVPTYEVPARRVPATMRKAKPA